MRMGLFVRKFIVLHPIYYEEQSSKTGHVSEDAPSLAALKKSYFC